MPREPNPDVADLIRAVEALPCSYSRRQMLRSLQGMAGRRFFISRRDLVAPSESALAVTLLAQMTIAETRDALMQRIGCGKSKAYRLITAALQARAGVVHTDRATPDGLRQLALALDNE